jgi:hypothetical protein
MPRILLVDESSLGISHYTEIVEVDESGQLLGVSPKGFIRIDAFGRAIFGACKSDEEHMMAEPASYVGDAPYARRRCCVYLEDLVKKFAGQEVELTLNATVTGPAAEEEEEAA